MHDLQKIEEAAYCERVLAILENQYSDCDLPEEDPNFRYARREDRDIIVANLIHIAELKLLGEKEDIQKQIAAMDDNQLSDTVYLNLSATKEDNELHQFHAVKAFNGYIDHVVRVSQKKAEQRFPKNAPTA